MLPNKRKRSRGPKRTTVKSAPLRARRRVTGRGGGATATAAVDDATTITPSILLKHHGGGGASGATIITNILMVDLMNPDPTQVAKALECLNELIDSDRGHHWKINRVQACHLGAHCMICATMVKFRANAYVQESGCICIQRLGYIDSNEDILIDCGAVGIILSALKAFPNHLGVQRAGCGALRNLLSGFDETSSKTKQTSTRRFVHEFGGFDAVTRAVRKFPKDEELLTECFVLFQNLAPKADYRSAMMDANVPSAASATLKRHSKDSKCNHEAFECILAIFDN